MKQSCPGSSAMGCGIRRRPEIFFLGELIRPGFAPSEKRNEEVGYRLGGQISRRQCLPMEKP
jgi:hypothetical protein